MKLFYKKYIDNYTRILYFLGIPIEYKKEFISEKSIINNQVKIFNFKFNIKKKKKIKKYTNNLFLNKTAKTDALMYMRPIRNLFSKINSVETIVLGSSAARAGYIENEKSVNFGIDAQDLYYSYQLFHKYKTIIPNLKNVILCYNVFSSGNDLDLHPQKYRMAYYSAYFDIPYKNKLLAISEKIIDFEKKLYTLDKYINKNLKNIPIDYYPILDSGFKTQSELEIQANLDIKLAYKNTMLHYVEKIADETTSQNLNFYIVLMPRIPSVLHLYPEKEKLFESIYSFEKKYQNIKIISAFSSCEFQDSDFMDLTHLKKQGAQKLTNIINNSIGIEK